jgi:hypothetical protein
MSIFRFNLINIELKVEEIVEIGELDPNFIHLPGIYVDRIIKSRYNEKRIEVFIIIFDMVYS